MAPSPRSPFVTLPPRAQYQRNIRQPRTAQPSQTSNASSRLRVGLFPSYLQKRTRVTSGTLPRAVLGRAELPATRDVEAGDVQSGVSRIRDAGAQALER